MLLPLSVASIFSPTGRILTTAREAGKLSALAIFITRLVAWECAVLATR
jgi:hypothetical protein